MTTHKVITLFISSVTNEFGSMRPQLNQNLSQQGVINVVIQEALHSTGTDTLLKLDDHIRLCDAVVHFAGDQTGSLPKRDEVPDLLARYPDLPKKLGLDAAALASLTRTQWEAWLGLYHGIRLLAATPLPGAPCDRPPADETTARDQRQQQAQHLERLADFGRKDRIEFDSYASLLNQLHHSLHLMQAQPAAQPGKPIDPTLQAHLAALRTRVLDNTNATPLDDTALQAIERHVPTTLEQFYLRQIAHWSRSVYQIDRRFTPLALRLNVEDEKTDTSYDDLRNVLRFLDTKHHHCLTVLGPPGAGKSTMLRRLGYDLAIDALRTPEQAARLPFYAELKHFELTAQFTTPRDWLASQWQVRGFKSVGAFEDLLTQGRLLLLLDAVNEMPCAASDYDNLLGKWSGFISPDNLPPGNQVVFSCRRLDYSRGLRIESKTIAHVEIESLGPEKIRSFLQLYLPGRDDLVADTYAALQADNSLELYNSPFYLSLLVDLVKQGGAVPRGRAALFSAGVRKSLQREQAKNSLFAPGGPLLSAEEFDQLDQAAWPNDHQLPQDRGLFEGLAALAHGLQTQGGGADLARRRALRCKTNEARTVLAAYAKSSANAEDLLAGALALHLLEKDVRTREVQFRHQLFQEYFAARGLVAQLAAAPAAEQEALAQSIASLARQQWKASDIRPTVEEELARLSMAQRLPQLQPTGWEETLRLAVAMATEPDALLRALADANLPLAGMSAAQSEAQPGEGLREELRRQLLARSRELAADLRARMAAGLALGELGDPRLTPAPIAADMTLGTGPLLPPFVTIPAGHYPMGVAVDQIPQSEWAYFKDAAPTAVAVASFELAQFPVTNKQWQGFMAAGGYSDASWWHSPAAQAWRQGIGTNDFKRTNARRFRQWALDGAWLEVWRERTGNEDEYKRIKGSADIDESSFEAMLLSEIKDQRFTEPQDWRNPAFNAAAQPVVGICWFEAQAYCAWLSNTTGQFSFRLPTEVEYEAATGGLAARPYAWGSDWQPTRSNTSETRLKGTAPVGVFPLGDTPQAVFDLSGNVLEWTSTLYGPTLGCRDPSREDLYMHADEKGNPMARAVRGASWDDHSIFARAAYRLKLEPGFRDNGLGFRVVRVSHP